MDLPEIRVKSALQFLYIYTSPLSIRFWFQMHTLSLTCHRMWAVKGNGKSGSWIVSPTGAPNYHGREIFSTNWDLRKFLASQSSKYPADGIERVSDWYTNAHSFGESR